MMSMTTKLFRVAAASALLLSLSPQGHAQSSAPRIERLEVVLSGFTGAGAMIEPGRLRRLFSRTPAVDARAGTGFGMTVRPIGQPKGADVTLRWVWKAPRPGIIDAATGKYLRQVSDEVPAKIGEEVRRVYQFKEANDLVLGNWRVEVWSGSRKLATQRFAVR
jgi:hypothetical protein